MQRFGFCVGYIIIQFYISQSGNTLACQLRIDISRENYIMIDGDTYNDIANILPVEVNFLNFPDIDTALTD